MSLAFATWVGAVATALLAVGAGLTVYYARKAFIAQSQQLRDQQEINRLQVQEIRESLAERKQGREQRRRAQAAQVITWPGDAPLDNDEDIRTAAFVRNSSSQPVYDVRIGWGGDSQASLGSLMPGDEHVVRGAGTSAADGTHAEFRDAAGVRWRTTSAGKLTELPADQSVPT